MAYRLSGKAEDDLVEIYLVGARTFGAAQAERYFSEFQDAFDFIAQFPKRRASERRLPRLSASFRTKLI